MLNSLLLVWVVLFGSSLSFAAPVIESISGAKTVTVITGTRSSEKASGAAVAGGDKIKTSSQVSARILYDDGSQLLVGRGTTVVVESKSGETQWNKLESGNVRAVVAKSAAANAKSPYRFGVKTRSVVMGVRGTDFVVDEDASGGASEVHTLDGQVDVADNENNLLSGKGTSLMQNQFIKARGGRLEKPQSFNRGEFLGKLDRKQPDFGRMMKRPPQRPNREAVQGNLAPRKERLREQQGHGMQDMKQKAPGRPVAPAQRQQGQAAPPAPPAPPPHVAPPPPQMPEGLKKRFGR